MIKKLTLIISFALLLGTTVSAQLVTADTIKSNQGDIIIQPITHGTLVLQWNNTTIYVDPYGGSELFEGIATPDFILITDIHGDHTNLETLKGLDTKKAKFIVPLAVAEILKSDYANQLEIIENDGMSKQGNMLIKAVPMYNLPEDKSSRHPKGRGNGYLFNLGEKTIYISGDTEDIKEMRALEDIDIAFVCMNLPYTMNVNQAANAVLEFKPKVVYPYHYRGKPDMSDTEVFKKLINDKNTEIEVRLRDWYSN